MAIPPLKIVGYEGLFGAISMLGIMLPIVQVRGGTTARGCAARAQGGRSSCLKGGDTRCTLPSSCYAAYARQGWRGHPRGLSGHLACEQLRLAMGPASAPSSSRALTGMKGCARPSCQAMFPCAKQMITHSSAIPAILALDMVALLLYNVSGMCVTGHLGAVFR